MYARIVHVAILIRDDQSTELVTDAMTDLKFKYDPLVLDWDFERTADGVKLERVSLPDTYREGEFTFAAEPAEDDA